MFNIHERLFNLSVFNSIGYAESFFVYIFLFLEISPQISFVTIKNPSSQNFSGEKNKTKNIQKNNNITNLVGCS